MPEIFCPWCVYQGGLQVLRFGGVPILECVRCKEWTFGHWEGTDAVFPDPHGQQVGQGT